MGWDAWLTLGVVAGTLLALARDLVPPALALLSAVVILMVSGVIDPQQAFAGFSNPAPITVAALFVLAGAVEKTGALQPLIAGVLDGPRGDRGALARLLVPTAAASAFLNNTPIVAMLVPQVTSWAARHGRSPSRFLMPLSFASILGGMVTLVGTSTNIVVSGMLESMGQAPLGMFELTRIGLPAAMLGVGTLVLLAPLVLRERGGSRGMTPEELREFVVGMRVISGGVVEGRTVAGAGLRNLAGVFLVEIERNGEFITPVGPETVLRGDDWLTFVGRADMVVELQHHRGLVSAEAKQVLRFDDPAHTFFEAVVGETSPLLGRTLKEAGFRSRYQAAVVAIHRAGQRVRSKLGEVRLRLGDTLLLLSDPGFRERWRDRNDFLLVARLGGALPTATTKAWLVGGIALCMVILAGVGLLPILHAALLGAVALVLFRVITPGEARAAVDLDVIIVIAAAFGLGAAMQASGLAEHLAELLATTVGSLGTTGALLGVVVATALLTEVVTNNVAAVLMVPIAWPVAEAVGTDPRSFAVAVAIAASASFLTPIGYQTNTMVYGPGGYRFTDYVRLGAPLNIVVLVTVIAGTVLLWS
jgi:di/tricarboxylate transporter